MECCPLKSRSCQMLARGGYAWPAALCKQNKARPGPWYIFAAPSAYRRRTWCGLSFPICAQRRYNPKVRLQHPPKSTYAAYESPASLTGAALAYFKLCKLELQAAQINIWWNQNRILNKKVYLRPPPLHKISVMHAHIINISQTAWYSFHHGCHGNVFLLKSSKDKKKLWPGIQNDFRSKVVFNSGHFWLQKPNAQLKPCNYASILYIFSAFSSIF